MARLAILLNPDVIAALLIVEGLLVVWRLAAVADAYRRGQGGARERGAALTAVALVFVLVPSIFVAHLTEAARQAAIAVFAPGDQAWVPSPGSGVGDDDFGVVPQPSFQPDGPELGRFTVLLIGLDSGPDRDHALTDTMIVASLDPVAGAVSMISIPRDLVDTPLPDGRVFRSKINELVSYANRFPDKFPGATSGQAVLAAAIGELLQIRIDGWAQVNLPGFVRVIDAIGGIDVTVTKSFCDARYDEYGLNGFAISPGRWHLDGQEALAYARVRKAAGENDFTRAARQGDIVVAARDRVVQGGFLTDPTGFIGAMGELLQTSLDPALISTYLGAAIGIDRDHIYREVIKFPLVQGAANDPRGSILVPRLDLIRELAVRAFPPAGTLPTVIETIPKDSTDTPTRTNLPPVTCYAPPPAPKPSVAPSPAPSAGPSAEPPSPTDGTNPTEPPITPEPTEKPGGGPKTPEPTEPAPDPTQEPVEP